MHSSVSRPRRQALCARQPRTRVAAPFPGGRGPGRGGRSRQSHSHSLRSPCRCSSSPRSAAGAASGSCGCCAQSWKMLFSASRGTHNRKRRASGGCSVTPNSGSCSVRPSSSDTAIFQVWTSSTSAASSISTLATCATASDGGGSSSSRQLPQRPTLQPAHQHTPSGPFGCVLWETGGERQTSARRVCYTGRRRWTP
jgi:hypothetical protein